MRIVADFHIHSKYSRATSSEMNIEKLSEIAKWKGINLLGTGDFCHPLWLRELKEKLVPENEGLFSYQGTSFILTTEVCNLFVRATGSKKIHNIIFAPSFEVVDKLNQRLARYGNLTIDGRPQLNLDARDLVKIVLDISPECLIVPSHVWTPWFSLFGSRSGFDSVEECFGEETKFIRVLETGLSSDPGMNWRISSLDHYTLISNSDAHSPLKIGRELNIIEAKLEYREILQALTRQEEKKLKLTVEFFPQEGKYHYDGHRNCNVRLSPEETKTQGGKCPKCGEKVTIGVMHRVVSLSDRPEGYILKEAPPYRNLVPLIEIIASSFEAGVESEIVKKNYREILQRFGSEIDILLNIPLEEFSEGMDERIAEGIRRVREGEVNVIPGYDGVYGEIRIFDKGEKLTQLSLF